jgi:hypothetical protein
LDEMESLVRAVWEQLADEVEATLRRTLKERR